MITLIEALNYRCIKHIRVPLKPFHVLVGPNASGKSTFMDVIGFVSDLLNYGLDSAILRRTSNPQDLLFQHQGSSFELALEARIPDHLSKATRRPDLDTVRYQVAIGFQEDSPEFEFKTENLLLKQSYNHATTQRSLFPALRTAPESIAISPRGRDTISVVNKVLGGNDNFYSEVYRQAGKGWTPSFRLGPKRSAFRNLLADERQFPVATWFQEYLKSGVQHLTLNSRKMRNPSPPFNIKGLSLDGSNLPWLIKQLHDKDQDRHAAWIRHLKTVLTDLVDISTVERSEDRHRYRYVVYKYSSGLRLPSWMASDGTLTDGVDTACIFGRPNGNFFD